jgi:DNA-binding HxlR family transcriptional regulator
MKDENKTIKLVPFIKSTELGKTLGSDGIIHMLTMINEQPMRYSDIEKSVDIPKSTLVRHLNLLYDFKVLNKEQFVHKGRKTHIYGLTSLGTDIVKFFKKFERITLGQPSQQKIFEIEKAK